MDNSKREEEKNQLIKEEEKFYLKYCPLTAGRHKFSVYFVPATTNYCHQEELRQAAKDSGKETDSAVLLGELYQIYYDNRSGSNSD